MKTAKRILLIGVALLLMLLQAGCMVISCEDCRPHRPRHLGRPAAYKVVAPPHHPHFP